MVPEPFDALQREFAATALRSKQNQSYEESHSGVDRTTQKFRIAEKKCKPRDSPTSRYQKRGGAVCVEPLMQVHVIEIRGRKLGPKLMSLRTQKRNAQADERGDQRLKGCSEIQWKPRETRRNLLRSKSSICA